MTLHTQLLMVELLVGIVKIVNWLFVRIGTPSSKHKENIIFIPDELVWTTSRIAMVWCLMTFIIKGNDRIGLVLIKGGEASRYRLQTYYITPISPQNAAFNRLYQEFHSQLSHIPDTEISGIWADFRDMSRFASCWSPLCRSNVINILQKFRSIQ